jgi:MYXO-CTERM domain-containing protein
MRRLLTLALLPSTALAQDFLDPAVENDLVLTLEVQGASPATDMQFLPDGRLLIITQDGSFLLWDGANLDNAGNLTVQSGGERGLLGVAIDPMFAQTNRIYFYYSLSNTQRVGYAVLNPATSQVDTANVTTIIDNLSANRNHDGGALRFGPDGNLYIGAGDTGCNCGCAPGTNTDNYFPTCLTKYHGKIMRIDREGAAPATNPLVGVASAPACEAGNTCGEAATFPTATADPLDEIYAWGFRNPWRIAFDEQTGYLWIGDVGEVTYEEITISTQPGEHHGWPFREGAEGQNVSQCQTVVPQSVTPCKDPAFAYDHAEAPASGSGSITGGVFSNHCSWPAPYAGLYWFGDYNKTRIWSVAPNANRDGIVNGSRQIIVRSANGPVSLANGPDGSIWYTTINDGEIWSIRPANPVQCNNPDAGQPDADLPDADAPDAELPDTGGPDGAAPDALAEDMGVGTDAAPDTGVADTGVAPKDGSVDTGTGGEEPDEDCGCTTAEQSRSSASILFGVFALMMIARRRR